MVNDLMFWGKLNLNSIQKVMQTLFKLNPERSQNKGSQ